MKKLEKSKKTFTEQSQKFVGSREVLSLKRRKGVGAYGRIGLRKWLSLISFLTLVGFLTLHSKAAGETEAASKLEEVVMEEHPAEDKLEENKEGENMGEENPEGEGPGTGSSALADWFRFCKRYQQLPIESQVRDKDTYYEFDNTKLAWWFKRDMNHGPSGCDDTIDISEYNAYYLDQDAIARGEKVIYLTFDCGFENGYTEQMLDVLKKENVPACFFVTQTYIRDNVAIVKRMKEEGHQVGNHTIYHICMPEKSYEENLQEICGCAEYMKEATGYEMDPYLRPPSGEYSARTLAWTRDLGYKTIFWSMAYMDFDVNNQPGVDFVVNHFEKYHHSGAIILMHNVSSSNQGALEKVIVNLKAEGYRFASLNELE